MYAVSEAKTRMFRASMMLYTYEVSGILQIYCIIRMRRKYDLDWRTIIKTKKLYHQQVYEFISECIT